MSFSTAPLGQAELQAPGAPAHQSAPLTRWQKLRLVVKVVELRLRFIALMAITGLVFAYWDTLWNRYEKWMRPAGGAQATMTGIEYYCPMHPQVVQDLHGTCPICGMPLARRKKGEKATLPPGVTARVPLAPFQVAAAGIKTVEVRYAPLAQALTTVGYVAFDERAMAHIVSKVPGNTRVEKLFVNFNGQDVMEGQILAELYSPELSQAIHELLSAARRSEPRAEPRTDLARALLDDQRAMVRASADKLKRWGITQAQVDNILKTGKTNVTFPILSPISGHVFKKNVVQGQEVPEGFPMFEVANLHTVWVQAQVYEHQVGLIHFGQPVEATVEAYPHQAFRGTVEFIQPHVDPTTRTVEVRYAITNSGHELRPGMFATVTIKTPIAETAEFRERLASDARNPTEKSCPVTGAQLGSMGPPIAVEVKGRTIWTCCDYCPPKVRANPTGYLAKLAPPPPLPDPKKMLTAAEQKICPVTNARLGSMGDPVLAEADGRKVWTCCAACPPRLKAEPARYLARLAPAPRNEVLTVPEQAVIDTGTRKVVYVETEPGLFEGREVILGPRVGDRYPVLEGLAPGDKVAAAGAFLIDAESRINPGAIPAPEEPAPPRAAEPTRDEPTRSAALPAKHTRTK
jgi:Cu(I)/Ag(I) efflux system membrane fusion protein